ncbi:MAG: mazE [Devosia sp.]|uniref:antitoxin MazE family protein n=1 Tax=Devosia sp. TaxID=1871048 RepID=UPI00262ACE41|nr:antitoxin MazE family protein [Devosia sp.]MDB5539483.1 mazE [Devosia sp.]
MASTAKSNKERVREHRARLRAQGLRPIQIWVPDTSSEEFKREARRQAQLIANSPFEAEDQAFIDSLQEWNDQESETWRNEK